MSRLGYRHDGSLAPGMLVAMPYELGRNGDIESIRLRRRILVPAKALAE